MTDELEFRRHSDKAVDSLAKRLYDREEAVGFEVEEQNGALNIVFENPAGRFVITPNAPAKQIWISALSTSFKLDWNGPDGGFYLRKTGEHLERLVARLISEQMGIAPITLP